MRILFAASEVAPLSKTGGLADVAQALPAALSKLGHEVRVVTPAYRGLLESLETLRPVTALELRGERFAVWEGAAAEGGPMLWLVDCPPLYAREDHPYMDAGGRDHRDNPRRFGLFCELIARLARGEGGLAGRADIVHLNDWHTGLAASWLRASPGGPPVVFTIHNLAYQGNYPADVAAALGLPAAWMTPAGIEFHGQLSFMKAGLVHADALTTVSPTYAREILTPEFGFGLEGVLQGRSDSLTGILNGIDTETWNPPTDRHLVRRYGVHDLEEGKRTNRAALQAELRLAPEQEALLVAYVGRLAYQKGVDLLLEPAAGLDRPGLQLALLGAGDRAQASALQSFAAARRGRISVTVGYDERLAHRIEAAADAFLMPSRYEPCGLNQMYSQRYGTVPLVRRTGGLADTVVDATAASVADGTATGIVFDHADAGAVSWAIDRAMELRQDAKTWRALQENGMGRDFGWAQAARRYTGLYRSLLRKTGTFPFLE